MKTGIMIMCGNMEYPTNDLDSPAVDQKERYPV